MEKYLSKTFEFKKYKTNMRTEIVAGFTTFATMGYIMFLNPFILSGEFAGESKGFMSFEFVYTATILASAIACFIMGFVGKTFPIGLAPGMGINAFVAFGVMGGMKYSPAEALALVLLSGILFLAVSLTPIRKYLINAIPRSLKLGIGAGIGLFLAIIGFEIMGLSVDHPVTLVTIGDMTNPLLILGGLAFVTMVVLEKYKVKGNILLSLILFSFIAWLPIWGFTGSTIEGGNSLARFNGILSMPPSLGYFMAAFDGFTPRVFSGAGLTVIFTLFFIDLFDTMGTLTSAANVCGRVNKKGEVENIEGPLVADSVGTVAGSMMGTSTVTSYVESGAGIKAGGRTGFVSIVVGIAFLLCLGFAPLATSLPKEVDGAALLYVAILFVRNITDISWDDISESSAAIVAMIAMPLTYSIANGIALAFITYALVRILTGQAAKTSGAIWIVAILSVLSFLA
jgi:AGZA family xanthine/uracil permease-like MFS transporter